MYTYKLHSNRHAVFGIQRASARLSHRDGYRGNVGHTVPQRFPYHRTLIQKFSNDVDVKYAEDECTPCRRTVSRNQAAAALSDFRRLPPFRERHSAIPRGTARRVTRARAV